MNIVTTISVPDYVYELYAKISQDLKDRTPEELMAQALFQYAGMIANDLLYGTGRNEIIQ